MKCRIVVSMIPEPKQKGQDYNTFCEKIKRKNKALCSTVMYVPNASGKTNIIGAVDRCSTVIGA